MKMVIASIIKKSLLKNKAFINGKWLDAEDNTTLAVTCPATGILLSHVPNMGQSETYQAIDAAESAFQTWRLLTAKERAAYLKSWYSLILENSNDLATLMTLEQGKPLAEARAEVQYGASFVEWFSEEGKRVYGETIPATSRDKRFLTIKQPIGVVGAITPWNFPLAMVTRKVAPALACGCTVVLKPSEETPLTALALVELAQQAGIPDGVFNVVTGRPVEIGKALTTSSKVRKITFTGSTAVGKELMRQSADTVKKISLELGGNAPFLVFDDADLDRAISGAISSKFRNAGQTCVCANRFLVQNGVVEEFTKRLLEAVSNLKVGNGLLENTDIGPLINEKAVVKIERLLEDAINKGAKILVGGKRHEHGGSYVEPTVVCDISTDMAIFHEEIFGPVATVMRFQDEREALDIANNTRYGLAAYFYSRDIGRVWRVAEGLEYGIVGINEGIISSEVAPFGGMKESGIGREGSSYGIQDFLEVKYLCLGDMAR